MSDTAQYYSFYWLDGSRNVLPGDNPADALNRAGFGAGAVRALDFVSRGSANDYMWNGTKWVQR